jgi:hypothetical protein
LSGNIVAKRTKKQYTHCYQGCFNDTHHNKDLGLQKILLLLISDDPIYKTKSIENTGIYDDKCASLTVKNLFQFVLCRRYQNFQLIFSNKNSHA